MLFNLTPLQNTVDSKGKAKLPGMGHHHCVELMNVRHLETEQGKNTLLLCETLPKHITH